jgi:DNA mismatch repair protein MSH4
MCYETVTGEADLPQNVLVEGKRVAKNLAALHARHEEKSESSEISMRRKALLRVCPVNHCLLAPPLKTCDDWQLRTQLTQALDHSALPDEELLAYIGRFQVDIARAFLHPSKKSDT